MYPDRAWFEMIVSVEATTAMEDETDDSVTQGPTTNTCKFRDMTDLLIYFYQLQDLVTADDMNILRKFQAIVYRQVSQSCGN